MLSSLRGFGLLATGTKTTFLSSRLFSTTQLLKADFDPKTDKLESLIFKQSSTNKTTPSLSFLGSKRNTDRLLNSTPNYSHPKMTAESLKLTGPIVGRVVRVRNGDISSAYQNLKRLINVNNIRGESMQQRFHMKPGKKLEMKRIKRKKKQFNEGIRRLMGLVTEAKRRGY